MALWISKDLYITMYRQYRLVNPPNISRFCINAFRGAYINGMLVILEYGIIANDLVLCYQLRYIFNKWHKICIFMYTYIYMYIYMCV